MAVNKAKMREREKAALAREREMARLEVKQTRQRQISFVVAMVNALNNENAKISALRELGFNDSRIGSEIGKTQGSIHGYRTANVQPPAEVDEKLDHILRVGITALKGQLKGQKYPEVIAMIEAKIQFAEAAL
jgi:hypothetical protein